MTTKNKKVASTIVAVLGVIGWLVGFASGLPEAVKNIAKLLPSLSDPNVWWFGLVSVVVSLVIWAIWHRPDEDGIQVAVHTAATESPALREMKGKIIAYRNAVWKPDDHTNEVTGVKTQERAVAWRDDAAACLRDGMVDTSFGSKFLGSSANIVEHWRSAVAGGAGYLNALHATIKEDDLRDHETDRVKQLRDEIDGLKGRRDLLRCLAEYIQQLEMVAGTPADARGAKAKEFVNRERHRMISLVGQTKFERFEASLSDASLLTGAAATKWIRQFQNWLLDRLVEFGCNA